MFEKNDKALILVRKLVIVLLVIAAVLSVIGGIIIAIISGSVLMFFLVALVGLIACGVSWLIWWLIFSYLCDIKLIRNKLYNVDNYNLNVFIQNTNEKYQSNNSEKLELIKLLKSGAITAEEYVALVRKLEDEDVAE